MSSNPAPLRVLFVCTGNICRSPLAEAIFRKLVSERGLDDEFIIDSAGTMDWNTGASPSRRMQAVAAEHGVQTTGAARMITPDDFRGFDYLICMDEDNREALLERGAPEEKVRMLMEFDPDAPMVEVPDPYQGDDLAFQHVYTLVDRACHALVDALITP